MFEIVALAKMQAMSNSASLHLFLIFDLFATCDCKCWFGLIIFSPSGRYDMCFCLDLGYVRSPLLICVMPNPIDQNPFQNTSQNDSLQLAAFE